MNDMLLKSQTASFSCDVLVVEDDPIQCEEIAGFLGRSGLSIETAQTASSALHWAMMHQPRVALLDYNLPEVNGVELAEQLRALLPHTKIIMMSGRIDGLSERTLEKIGITVFVNKPLPLAPLRNAVWKLARAAQSPSPKPQIQQRGWLAAGVGGTR